ncbi:MAG: hypothetical protein CVT72_08095 [Alphaproteobacteria bacterium HGW-Alphaproteobacteria-11]|nr:MAG: hypothetical protein CVT72_08095 [Alphaproteobacteria bacterium HGW-Alphaproteobacteria-11]
MSASLLSKTLIAAIAATAFYAAPVSVASAQEMVDDRNVGVRDRARPGYDAAGIRAGGFMVYPEASVTGTYNDNIFASDVGEVDDFITTLAAGVAVQSNWNRHALNLNAGLAQYLYADNSDEDRFDWNIGGNGRVDVTRDTNLSGGLSYAELHEDRGAPNAVGLAAEPTEYSLFRADIALAHRFNRVTTRVGAGYTDYDYDDTPLIGGGIADQDFRDREEFEQFARLGYDVSPDTNLYIQGTLNQREYDLKPPVVALNRDSDGYAVVGGADFRLTNLAQGEVYIGYQEQSFDDPTLPNISGLAFGAAVDWFVTPLTTVRIDAASTVEETVAAGSSGFLDQSVGLGIDHELMRNVIVGARASYANQDFEGIGRSDDVIRAGLGVDYLINRNFSAGLEYGFTNRDSNAPGLDYTRNEVGLTLRAAF